MSSLDPALQAAVDADVVHMFVALEVMHPGYTIRLIDGAGTLHVGFYEFVGFDSYVGSIGSIELSQEGTGDQAPTLSVDIVPADMTIMGIFGYPQAQGCAVTLSVGAFDPATGLVIGTADVRFTGELDTVEWIVDVQGGAGTVMRLGFTSAFERFFDNDEGNRLSDSFHQSVWPGELAFEYMDHVFDQLPWGADGPRPPVISGRV